MGKELDLKFLFPNLIILLGTSKKDSLFKQLKKCFDEFQYQPLFKIEKKCYNYNLGREISTCRIMQGNGIPLCLAEGEGTLPCDAEQQAAEKLLNKLCDSFYVIKANPQYFSRNNVPPMVLDADPSQSHVYKVVFLKKNSRGAPFPKPVSGAIDYVEDYNELFKYIEIQAKSETKADIFILNVLKCDRANIRELCQKNGYSVTFLVGCSDMGIHAFFNMSTLLIQQSLLKDGGKNVKYKFIGPRDKYGDNEDTFDKYHDSKVASVQYKHLTEEGGEIVIDGWISEHLVLMDVFTESNELESVKEIIWQSVRDCPDTQEFIIEKTRSDGGMIYADAMIDRKVVGRARGFKIDQVKIEAAANAMHNLSKYCRYIVAKRSYFGSSQELPSFLQDRIPIQKTKIYRIERKSNYPPNKVLQEFKSSSLEDIYFLDDFSAAERNSIALLAKGMRFLVRWVGWKHILCVYKRRKSKEVLMELLSTQSKENEKYKLIIPIENSKSEAPPASENRIKQEWEGSMNKQEESCQRWSVAPESSGSCSSSSMPQPQANSQDHRDQYDDHERVSAVQESKDLGQAGDEIPEWVNKYIQSASNRTLKSTKRQNNFPTTPESKQTKAQDDVYSRYKSTPPRTTVSQQFHTSNFNNREAYQRPNLNFNQGPQASFTGQRPIQRFDQETMERFNPNFDQVSDQRSNPNLIQGTDQKSNRNFKQESNQGLNKDFCESEDKELSLSERLHRKLAALNRTNNLDSMNQRYEPTCSNSYKRSSSDFTSGTESHQRGNNGMNQQYKQPNISTEGPKKFSYLFDFDGSSDSQAPSRTPDVHQNTWVKNKKFRGHNFSKLAKYGQQKGPRGRF